MSAVPISSDITMKAIALLDKALKEENEEDAWGYVADAKEVLEGRSD